MKRSEILNEALEYIRRFRGATFVVKFGGEVLGDEEVVSSVAKDLAFLEFVGINAVVVHGGGKRISSTAEAAGIKPTFINGLRVTDAKTMAIVAKVLHEINQEIVSTILKVGCPAVGLNPPKEMVFATTKRKGEVDMGLVGDISSVKTKAITSQFSHGVIPVITPLGVGKDGEIHNINADTAASALAKGLNAEKFILITTVDGVLDQNKKKIDKLTVTKAKKLVKSSSVSGGMVPKLNACIEALEDGVASAHIVKASKHALLEEILTREGTGTMITRQ